MKKQGADKDQGRESPTFESSLKALEQIVERLESGELPLEEAMQLFEEGMHHAKRCEELLQQVEGKIQKLIEARDGSLELAEVREQTANG